MKQLILKLGACLTVIALAVLFVLPVLASDISNADFYGYITTTNNSTAATLVTSNVSGLDTADMIAGGYLNSSANNCAIRNSSGADLVFMPGYGSNSWCIFFPSIGANTIRNSIAYFKNVTGGNIKYIPGSTGMRIVDNISIESSNNITTSFTSVYINNSVNNYVFKKPGAYTANITSGNFTFVVGTPSLFSIFTPYTETDPGNDLTVTAYAVRVDGLITNQDTFVIKDYGAGYFNAIYYPLTMNVQGQAANPFGRAGVAFANTANQDIGGLAATDIWVYGEATAAATVRFVLGRGASIATDTSVATVPGTYKLIFARTAGNDNATCTIYTTAGVVVDTLTIAGVGAGTTWRYHYSLIDSNDGLGRQFDGYIATNYLINTAITSGEKSSLAVSVNAISGNATLWQNGAVLQSTSLNGVSIPNLSSNITTGGPGTIYLDTFSISVNGTVRARHQWQYAATFTDLSGNGNTGYPSFCDESSDPDVTSVFTLFQPISEPIAPPFAVGAGPDFLDSSNLTSASSNFTTGNVTKDYPLKDLIEGVANAGGVPYQIPSTFIASFGVLAVSLLTSYFLKRYSAQSIFIKSIVNTAAYGLLVTLGIYDWWMLIFFFIFEQAIWFGAQHRRE